MGNSFADVLSPVQISDSGTPGQANDETAFQDWMGAQKKNRRYIGKENKKKWWDQRNALKTRQAQAQNAMGGTGGANILSGSAAEQEGQIAGLNLGNLVYGQGLGQAGEDVQRLKGQLKARSEQSDPISEAIRSQKSGAVASAQRNLAAAGVKGGAAAGALEEIDRKQSADIAASLYGQQRQSLSDERNMVSNIISGQTGLMYGEKAANQQMPRAPGGGGFLGMDSVICTELYRQGYMDLATYAKDAEYGRQLYKESPEIVIGYHFWAKPIVKLMKKSPIFTKIISYPALKWARHIANEENSIFGILAVNIGQPICGIIGKLLTNVFGAKYV